MKKSYYNIEVRHNGKNIIFNTKSRACVLLDNNEYNCYINERDGNLLTSLSELGIYVDDEIDEQAEVLNIITNNIEKNDANIRSHTIYTTTYCNANCPYCFEADFPRETMNKNTAKHIANYIIHHQDHAQKLYVIWFGGEPLLNKSVIDIISDKIKKNLPSNVEFRSSIYTNGILFSDDLIKHSIKHWNLKAVQITLDGLKSSYEYTKQFAFENAFEKIIERIKSMANAGLRVQIRLNYHKKNLNEILGLIDFLADNLPKYKNIYVYAHKIFSNNEDNSKTNSFKYDFIIFKKLVECGFCNDIIGSIKGNLNPCLAGSNYSTRYLPSGDIIKCERDCKSIIGDIYGKYNSDEVNKWLINRFSFHCYKCKVFPLCGGGCRYEFINQKMGCMTSEEFIRKKLQYYIENIN